MQPQPVTGTSFNVSAGFTRPADTNQYTAGDAMGNSTTAAQNLPLELAVARKTGGTFGLQRARLISIGGTSLTAASFTLLLFYSKVAFISGDNAAMTIPSVKTFFASVSITQDTIHTDGTSGFVNVAMIGKVFDNSYSLFGYMQSVSTYTPISAERFVWTLEGIVD